MNSESGSITLLIATRNTHKVGEIRAVLGGRFRYLTLAALPGAPSVIEDADTFAGNAAKKAGELMRWLLATDPLPEEQRVFVLADDSGLEVDALGGAPGVHSARFAALDSGRPGNSTDADNNARLLRLLKDVPLQRRTARFRCVLALVRGKDARAELFDGVCEGRLEFAPRGGGGFGYDPLFVPDGFRETFAELGEAEKNKISHRARALAKLKEALHGPR